MIYTQVVRNEGCNINNNIDNFSIVCENICQNYDFDLITWGLHKTKFGIIQSFQCGFQAKSEILNTQYHVTFYVRETKKT